MVLLAKTVVLLPKNNFLFKSVRSMYEAKVFPNTVLLVVSIFLPLCFSAATALQDIRVNSIDKAASIALAVLMMGFFGLAAVLYPTVLLNLKYSKQYSTEDCYGSV